MEVTNCLIAMGTRHFEPSDLLVGSGWVQRCYALLGCLSFLPHTQNHLERISKPHNAKHPGEGRIGCSFNSRKKSMVMETVSDQESRTSKRGETSIY